MMEVSEKFLLRVYKNLKKFKKINSSFPVTVLILGLGNVTFNSNEDLDGRISEAKRILDESINNKINEITEVD